jgi:hypothetical protein
VWEKNNMIVYTDAFMVRIERLSLNNIPISQMMRNKEPISRCVYLNIYQMNCVFDDTTNRLVWFYSVERHFQQYFSYIVAVSFIGGRNQRTVRKPPACHKSLRNFITQCCIEYTSPERDSNS